jgi:hypothetical protein
MKTIILIFTKLWKLIYPPTKAKLHHLSHILGVLVTAGLMAALYMSTRHLPLYQHLGATIAPLVPLFTKWQAIITWFDRDAIDRLPIPSGDEIPAPPTFNIDSSVVDRNTKKDPIPNDSTMRGGSSIADLELKKIVAESKKPK